MSIYYFSEAIRDTECHQTVHTLKCIRINDKKSQKQFQPSGERNHLGLSRCQQSSRVFTRNQVGCTSSVCQDGLDNRRRKLGKDILGWRASEKYQHYNIAPLQHYNNAVTLTALQQYNNATIIKKFLSQIDIGYDPFFCARKNHF